jgi:hypothetical protein
MLKKLLNFLFGLLFFIFMFLSFKNFFYHYKEEQMISEYLKSHGIKFTQPLSKDLAVKVSEIVYKEFNTNPHTWKHFNLHKRPFLRNSVLELLTWKEGLCGEEARVVVKLLQKLGFDATRVQLYKLELGKTGHVVVSVKIKDREFFVDTINSSSWFHKIVRKADVGPYCYFIIHYKKRFAKRTEQNRTEQKSVIC